MTTTTAITFVIISQGEEVAVEIASTEDACKIAEIFVNNGVIFQMSYSSATA
ncbi:hypothetical protein [Nonomuraea recticatena]|uniref:Uncharacterized protein n=1 Tax=Nonomuraea recticatena TaxID=46178 RepID=A0ABN3TFI8_9ACTN